jgi:hypothetical protein
VLEADFVHQSPHQQDAPAVAAKGGMVDDPWCPGTETLALVLHPDRRCLRRKAEVELHPFSGILPIAVYNGVHPSLHHRRGDIVYGLLREAAFTQPSLCGAEDLVDAVAIAGNS